MSVLNPKPHKSSNGQFREEYSLNIHAPLAAALLFPTLKFDVAPASISSEYI